MVGAEGGGDHTKPCADERAYTFTLNEYPLKNIIFNDFIPPE